MTDMTEKHRARLERIAQARADLAQRKAQHPDLVDHFELRMARLNAARKRERERFETKVLGQAPELPPLKKPKGMSKPEWKIEKRRLQDEALAALSLSAKWSHKQGTPETLEKVGLHTDCLDQLERNGSIDKEQREWAAQIANVYRSIESDVAVSVASLEARVDQSRNNGALVSEGIHRIRLHLAYGYWRDRLPAPKQMILDMIVGDAIGYTVAAKRYGVHNRKAKRLLLGAIDIWPNCVDHAFHMWTDDEIRAVRDAA